MGRWTDNINAARLLSGYRAFVCTTKASSPHDLVRHITERQNLLVSDRFTSVAEVREGLRGQNYLADDGIAGVVFLADRLGKPILCEGPAGTGKTELAKAVAKMTGARLIRLQCYEGLDESKALYEWNYKKQLLRIQAQRVAEEGGTWTDVEEDKIGRAHV